MNALEKSQDERTSIISLKFFSFFLSFFLSLFYFIFYHVLLHVLKIADSANTHTDYDVGKSFLAGSEVNLGQCVLYR